MNEVDMIDNAIAKMRAPSAMSVICIDITNKCDLDCSNCTRLLANQETLWEMSLENFRAACESLKEFPGTIAVIGGNPCMHSKFPEICSIFSEVIQNKEQRGLWTNNAFKHQDICVKTFGGFNLNPHGVVRGYLSLKSLYKKTGKVGNLYFSPSHHSPLLTAVKDLFKPAEMWEKISECDINKNWSGTLIENKGKLRAYFCEVAASFDLANGTDVGMDVAPNWWKLPIQKFGDQIKSLCPNCGVPARLKGHMDYEETDTYTVSNIHLVNISLAKKRKVKLLEPADYQNHLAHKVTEYTETHFSNKVLTKLKNLIKRALI